MAITNASMHQAVTSSTAAQAIAVLPKRVFDKPRSSRIRANTGNAVMLMAIPMKSAKPVKEVLAGAKGGKSPVLMPCPGRKGTMMLAWLTMIAEVAFSRRCCRSNSIPTTNMKSTTPIWLSRLSAGIEAGGKSKTHRLRREQAQHRRAQENARNHFAHHRWLTNPAKEPLRTTGPQ